MIGRLLEQIAGQSHDIDEQMAQIREANAKIERYQQLCDSALAVFVYANRDKLRQGRNKILLSSKYDSSTQEVPYETDPFFITIEENTGTKILGVIKITEAYHPGLGPHNHSRRSSYTGYKPVGISKIRVAFYSQVPGAGTNEKLIDESGRPVQYECQRTDGFRSTDVLRTAENIGGDLDGVEEALQDMQRYIKF